MAIGKAESLRKSETHDTGSSAHTDFILSS